MENEASKFKPQKPSVRLKLDCQLKRHLVLLPVENPGHIEKPNHKIPKQMPSG